MELRDKLKLNWAWPTIVGGTGGYLLTKIVESNSKIYSMMEEIGLDDLVTNTVFTIMIGSLIGFGASAIYEHNSNSEYSS